jgi:hypothetical protein
MAKAIRRIFELSVPINSLICGSNIHLYNLNEENFSITMPDLYRRSGI